VQWDMIAKMETSNIYKRAALTLIHPPHTTPHFTAQPTKADYYIRLSSPPPFCSPFVAASPLPCSSPSFVSLLSGFFPCR